MDSVWWRVARCSERGLQLWRWGKLVESTDRPARPNQLDAIGRGLQARAVIGVDAGPLHIAAAVGTPTYAIVGNDGEGMGASPVRLWMPVAATSHVASALLHAQPAPTTDSATKPVW